MKNKTRLKEQQIKEKQILPVEVDAMSTVPKQAAQERHLVNAKWAEAVSVLQGEKFDSIDQAVERIADLVLTNQVLNESQQTDYREFLKATLATDPVLTEQLKSSLKIAVTK